MRVEVYDKDGGVSLGDLGWRNVFIYFVFEIVGRYYVIGLVLFYIVVFDSCSFMVVYSLGFFIIIYEELRFIGFIIKDWGRVILIYICVVCLVFLIRVFLFYSCVKNEVVFCEVL